MVAQYVLQCPGVEAANERRFVSKATTISAACKQALGSTMQYVGTTDGQAAGETSRALMALYRVKRNITFNSRGLLIIGRPFVFRGRSSRNATVRPFRCHSGKPAPV